MSRFISCAADLFDKFERHRIASNKWSVNYRKNLKIFDKFCAQKYPNAKELTQIMIDEWCEKRQTELPDSRCSRICVIVSLLKFLQRRNILKNIIIPEVHQSKVNKYIPHAFTQDELSEFFQACDNISIKNNSLSSRLKKLQLPIMNRLLLSSGMRTKEVRMLRVNDIDLNTGCINIRSSKANNQHYVVLGEYMLEIMRKYDEVINNPSLCPNREFFFPSANGNPHTEYWLSDNFKKCWNSNHGRAVPYDLRHQYATQNINSWKGQGFEVNAKLVYLSKSMGHSKLDSTKYYFSLTPVHADIMHELTNDTIEEIIPDVDDENN